MEVFVCVLIGGLALVWFGLRNPAPKPHPVDYSLHGEPLSRRARLYEEAVRANSPLVSAAKPKREARAPSSPLRSRPSSPVRPREAPADHKRDTSGDDLTSVVAMMAAASAGTDYTVIDSPFSVSTEANGDQHE